jgi:hypothetical protein
MYYGSIARPINDRRAPCPSKKGPADGIAPSTGQGATSCKSQPAAPARGASLMVKKGRAWWTIQPIVTA